MKAYTSFQKTTNFSRIKSQTTIKDENVIDDDIELGTDKEQDQDRDHVRSNINKEEVQALVELRWDSSKVILTADKGVALVIMDKPDYNKAQELLNDKKTYKEISTDPTNKLKTKLISLLKKIKAEGGIEEQVYKKMYPTGAVAPKFYWLP